MLISANEAEMMIAHAQAQERAAADAKLKRALAEATEETEGWIATMRTPAGEPWSSAVLAHYRDAVARAWEADHG